MSPEVILCRGHTTKADIYSMGATIIHMQTGIPPWVNRYPRSAYPSYLYIVSVLSKAIAEFQLKAFLYFCWESFSHIKTIKIFVREMISSFLLRGREGRSGFWSFRGRQETEVESSLWFVLQFIGPEFTARTGLEHCETWLKQAHLCSTCLFCFKVADKNWSLANMILWFFQCGTEIWWICIAPDFRLAWTCFEFLNLW